MKYQVKTILLGLLAVPLLVALPVTFATTVPQATVWKLVVAVAMALLITVPLLRAWGRRDDRPGTWLPALLPVVIVPALFLLLWVVTYAVTYGVGDTLRVFALPALPYVILSVYVVFGGYPLLVPVTLATVLVGSVAGFLWGASGTRRPAGRRVPMGVVVASLALATVAGVQVGQQLSTAVLLDGHPPTMSDVLDLSDYEPFVGGKLVKPDEPSSLTIASDLPRLDGATALYPVYAAIAQATYAHPGGLDADEESAFIEKYVPCHTTSDAYDRLIAGEADAIFVAQPSKGQLAKAEAAGVQLALTPIGREAFVFFVNKDNPVENLTLDQVRDIYSRHITNWKQVGGADEPIIAFQRPDDSGSQTAMLALVMKDRAIAQPMKEETGSGMGDIISAVAEYRDLAGAVGYSFRWYATVMNANPDIKLLSINGLEPTVANIRNGSYPLTGELNIVTTNTRNPNVQKLIDWTVSAEGQALIEKAGYVGR
jgi:phosphate transport system substrate-binding protein